MALTDLSKLNRQRLDQLGRELKAESIRNEDLRKEKEQEFLENLREMECIYDPDSIARLKMTPEEAKIYPGFIRGKVIPLESKLKQHLIPDKDPNWNINTTPVPAISQKTLDYVVKTLIDQMTNQSGQQITGNDLTVEQIEATIKAVTATKAENMKVVMSDQLLEDKYKDIQEEALKSGIRQGTGIIKGALSKPYTSTKIVKHKDPVTGITSFKQETKNHFRPSGECGSIWCAFPDMSSVTLDKCRFWDTLRSDTKHFMKGLAKRKDFFGDIILEYLKKNPKGTYKLRAWEIETLNTGTHNINTPQFLSDEGYSASAPQQTVGVTQNYEVIERDCYIDGWQLFEMGIAEEVDIDSEYFCNVWLLGDKIIKIDMWDEKLYTCLEDLYHLFYYYKDETSIFGKGLPKVGRYVQLSLAACDRNMLRNAAWVAGPCGDVNVNGMTASQVKDANQLYPGKLYVADKAGSNANNKTLNLYNIDSRITEFIAMKNDLRAQGDSDTSLPSYLFGDTSGNAKDTPVGNSKMQFSSLIDFIKNIVGNFDKMHKSYLNSIYKWNMAFNPDENIKGDMEIETIGSAAAIINEAIIQQWAFMVQSLPDEAKDRIDWDFFLQMYGKHSGLPDYDKIILSPEAYQKKVEQRQKNQERQMAIQEGLAQAKMNKDNQSAAKTMVATEKLNAEIPHSTEGKAIDNQSKQIDNIGKVVDMKHKNAQIQSIQANDVLKAAEAIKGASEPVPA